MNVNTDVICINLSDGTSCYGKAGSKPNTYWLRRTTGTVSADWDALAPAPVREQAEKALAAGGWPPGSDIVVDVQPRLL